MFADTRLLPHDRTDWLGQDRAAFDRADELARAVLADVWVDRIEQFGRVHFDMARAILSDPATRRYRPETLAYHLYHRLTDPPGFAGIEGGFRTEFVRAWAGVRIASCERILPTAARLATEYPLPGIGTRTGKRTTRYLRFVSFCAWLSWLRNRPRVFLPLRSVADALSPAVAVPFLPGPRVSPNSVMAWIDRAVGDEHLARRGAWRWHRGKRHAATFLVAAPLRERAASAGVSG